MCHHAIMEDTHNRAKDDDSAVTKSKDSTPDHQSPRLGSTFRANPARILSWPVFRLKNYVVR